jgi:hypothetical protein
MPSIKGQWEMVRKEFFPRWDREKKWKCFATDAGGSDGECLKGRKIIKLANFTSKTLLLLLVHEICHSVTRGGHGKEWCARMATAAKRADAIRMKSLAAQIRKEVQDIMSSPATTAADVYDRMQEVVWGCKNISFRNAVEGIGREFGMSRSEFLSKFPRLRSIYDEAKSMNW